MATRYIPYFPNTVQGQALLNNFARTQRILRYRDNGKVVTRIQRGMPFYEVECVEQVGDVSENMLLQGDCVSACAYLKDKGIKVDLVYIDPPFASGADYAKKIYLRRNPKVAEALEQAGQELDNAELQAFEEKMYGDIWKKEDYLNWMYENLMAIKSIMSESASIYVHLDWHIGHYVKILMDEIFGEENFRNEIVWKRSTAHNDSTGFGNLHDTIFYYALNDNVFNTQYVSYSEDYISTYYRHKDEDGRVFLDRDLSAKGLQGAGYTYEWKGKAGYWRCPLKRMEELDKIGRLYYTTNGTPRFKQYLDEMPGVPAQDIWTDIYAVNSQAEERVDYSTQKPEALLERIIKASSNEGMVVADFFGGSGVTAKVANTLGRKFVSSDVNINSLQTMRDRLKEAGADFSVMKIKDGISLINNPVQTMDKLNVLIPGLRDEPTISNFWIGSIVSSKYGMMPVFVQDLKDSTNRVLDIPTMNRILKQELPELSDEVKKVVVYYLDIENIDEIKKFIHEENGTLIEVELKDLKIELDKVFVEDDATWQLTEITNDVLYHWQVTLESFISDRITNKIADFNIKAQTVHLATGRPQHRLELSAEGLEAIEMVSLDCTAAEGVWHSDAEVKIATNGKTIIDGKKTNQLWDSTIKCELKPLRMKIRNIMGDETVFNILTQA